MINISVKDYTYKLPEDSIAKYPLEERDNSRLLIYAKGAISEDKFINIAKYLGKENVLVFNNSRVVRARLKMRKESGAEIEIFCLEPHSPIDFDRNFASQTAVKWRCLIGNLKKWKSGTISMPFFIGDNEYTLYANKLVKSGESWVVEFHWTSRNISFGEVLEMAGRIPIPPYLNRNAESIDETRYQTVYCTRNGSVAAPTAGLHFTDRVMERISLRGTACSYLTLHVSAGTFQPVKTSCISNHQMHTEHFFVTTETISEILTGDVIAVGTTTMRSLESLYWIGVSIIEGTYNAAVGAQVGQWDPYRPHREISSELALKTVEAYIKEIPGGILEAKTSMIIIPGYKFRIVKGLITNFHQPGSTLLLLVAAFAGKEWREMYNYAINGGFRFLSYGDSSLIIP